LAVIIPFSPPDATIDRLVELANSDMLRVNAEIVARTGSEVTMIPEVANHLISSGGKRLRPMLTLAMAGLTGYSGDAHVKLAAAVEFMHTATLLHDDVVDESEMRRGKLAARMLWGNEASVLVGDFLLGQAFKIMVEVGSMRALEILSTAAAVIAEGEVMQLGAAKNTATTEDEYLAVIRAKTAELFAAACEVGPVLTNRPKAEAAACRSFGMNLGIAFQLVDDALDYGGEQEAMGKAVGIDLRGGQVTFPLLAVLPLVTPAERRLVRSVVERRQQIGMLRAIGYQTESIALTFVLESTFVAAMGILSGVVGGVIVSRNLFTTGQFSGEGIDFTMPWGEVAVFVGLAVIVSLIMTWWPSRSAAGVPVAEALRYE